MTSKKKRNAPSAWLWRDAGNQLTVIERSYLLPATASVTSDVDTELLCSYNWTNHRKPNIYVPGGAPSWTGGDSPKTISPDSGCQYIDQDGAKVPKYPFESVFRAMEIQRPECRFDSIDCLVNRNSLRKLLDFCSASRIRKDFRLNLSVLSNTLIIERCEKITVERLRGSVDSGYGHNFERAFTKYPKDLENSTSHHRVLQYKLGDLKMAVRFEVDASHDLDAKASTQTTLNSANSPSTTAQLSKDLDSLKISSGSQKGQENTSSSIVVHRKGKGTPQSTTVEIKTAQKLIPMPTVLPQMWFGRTQWIAKGVHSDGEFHKISIEPIDLKLWENGSTTQLALRKLAALIERLRDIVIKTSNQAAIVVFQRGDAVRLKVLEREVDRLPLPKDIIERFWYGEWHGFDE